MFTPTPVVRTQHLMDCATLLLQGPSIPDSKVGLDLVRRWTELVNDDAMIVAQIRDERQRLLGFGATVFLENEYLSEEIARARSHISQRLLAQLGALSASPILDSKRIRSANTTGELHLYVLHHEWDRNLLEGQALYDLRAALIQALLLFHVGFNLKRVVAEGFGVEDLEWAKAVGFNHVASPKLASTTRNRADPASQPYVVSVTATEALSGVHDTFRPLFTPEMRKPTIRLSRALQRMLELAAFHARSDEEIADDLALSPETIRGYWVDCYKTVKKQRPDLLTRTSRQRHDLIQHIRRYPQNLRPFHRSAFP